MTWNVFAKMLVSGLDYLLDCLLLAAFLPVRGAGGRKLLLVRPDRIGDMVLWLPSAQRIIDSYRARGFAIALAVNPQCAALVGALSGVDTVLPVDRSRFLLHPLARARLLWRIRRLGACEAIQPTLSRELAVGDAIVRFSGAHRRLAWAGDLSNVTRLGKWLGDRAYTELLPNPDSGSELERNEALVERLGVPLGPPQAVPLPRRAPSWQPPPEYVVLFPGARRALRQWPLANFAQLAERLAHATGLPMVVCGAGRDRELARAMAKAWRGSLIDLTGRTDLPGLVDVLAGARLVVSNDTAAIHLAAALTVPSVCIMGDAEYGRFLPYGSSRLAHYRAPRPVHHPLPCGGCNWRCHRATPGNCAPCIAAIPWTQVETACMEELFPAR